MLCPFYGFARRVHFQGLLRRCVPHAAFGGANRHPRLVVRSPLSHRSDVVLPLKAQPKKMRNAKAFFSGTTSSLRSSCRRKRRGEPTSEISSSFSPALSFGCGSSPESATKENEECKSILSGTTSSLRSSCRRKRRGEPTSENNISFSPALSFGCGSSPESATKEKEMQKCISFFLVHFQGLEPWAH